MKSVLETSNAKIILMGEHSVVYGQPAIALPIKNIKTTTKITANEHGVDLISRYYTGDLNHINDNLKGIKTLITSVLNSFNQTNVNIDIRVDSDIPAERGMGSSAAAAVSITRALYDYFQHPLTRNKLLQTVNISEKIIHGNPSGIDSATTSSNVPIWFQKDGTIKTIPLNITGYLVIADSGVKGKTSEAVQIVRNKLNFDSKNMNLIQQLGSLTEQAAQQLENNELVKLGESFNSAQNILGKLGVSHPALEKLIQVANQNGSLGTKLTGGGLGGCLIALSPDLSTAKQITAALSQNGATDTWIENL